MAVCITSFPGAFRPKDMNFMKKTFQLQVEGKNPDRILEAVKHDVRKYVRRERRRDLPQGVDFWDFGCRIGATPEEAGSVHLDDLTERIDVLAREGAAQVYLEILAQHGHRKSRPVVAAEPDAQLDA